MTKEKSQARREHLAKMRASQKSKERRMALLMWGVGGLVIVLIVGAVGFYLVKESAATSLDSVSKAAYVGSQHTTKTVTYKESPPIGGEHHPYWQNCGIYDKPVHPEHAVHSMEHGAVWITYRPGLPAPQLERLKTLASADYMLLSPVEGLSSPIVASSWNHQLSFQNADDPKLPAYIKKYKQNASETPEFGAACTQGIDTTKDQAPLPQPSEAPHPDPTVTPTATPSS
ncbi:DUF3105 domain-containing protein [Nonomuraea sp. NPDC046570]|uniref:DUF3105 domain-containing protein n=1 Tax=Nonomuraea sp. NPDC046570 TaxID=3155255 RepID=UPI00340AD73B